MRTLVWHMIWPMKSESALFKSPVKYGTTPDQLKVNQAILIPHSNTAPGQLRCKVPYLTLFGTLMKLNNRTIESDSQQEEIPFYKLILLSFPVVFRPISSTITVSLYGFRRMWSSAAREQLNTNNAWVTRCTAAPPQYCTRCYWFFVCASHLPALFTISFGRINLPPLPPTTLNRWSAHQWV